MKSNFLPGLALLLSLTSTTLAQEDTVTLGFLDSTETTSEDGKRRVNSALYTWKLSTENRREAQVPAEFTRVRDLSEFHALHNPVISANGAWMAVEERPDRGDENVRVWSAEGDVTFTIERGQDPRISRDSRWVSALQKPPLEDSTFSVRCYSNPVTGGP